MPESALSRRGGGVHAVRQRKRGLVLRYIRQQKAASRQEIAHRLGLTEASVSRTARELIDFGLLCENTGNGREGKLGRPHVELCLNPRGAFIAGACFSAFSSHVSLTDMTGRRLLDAPIPKADHEDPHRAIEVAGAFIRDAVANLGIEPHRLFGVGVAAAGSVDADTGEIIEAPLLGWREVALREQLQMQTRAPVTLRNVADAIASLARRSLSDTPLRNLFVVHVAVGMGASLLLDGRLIHSRQDEGAIGHVPCAPGTEQCWCGQTGCLETVVSGDAIVRSLPDPIRRTITSFQERVTADALLAAIRQSNEGVTAVAEAFGRAGRELGKMLVALTAAVSPDAILISGPLTRAVAFVSALKTGYEETRSPVIQGGSRIYVRDLEYLEAAEALALEEFVFSDRLALPRMT